MKKILGLLLALAMILSLTACGTSTSKQKNDTTGAEATKAESSSQSGEVDMSKLKGLKVGFAQSDNSSNWKIVETESIQKEAKKYGVDLVYSDASGKIAKQASDIEDMVSQGVKYLIIAPGEEDGLQSAINSAMNKGIKVILVDRKINGEPGKAYTTKIMSNFVWEAEQAADKVIKETGGKGNVVILQGTQGATSTTERQKGFMDKIKGTELKVISDQVANYSMPKAQEVMENILQAQGKNINIVYAHGADMAIGAIAAIKAAGYKPGVDMKVVSVDASKDALEAIVAGEQLATVSCSPYFGPQSFELIAKMASGGTVEPSYTNKDTLYDKTNVDVSIGY